jgi:hypothetical protein
VRYGIGQVPATTTAQNRSIAITNGSSAWVVAVGRGWREADDGMAAYVDRAAVGWWHLVSHAEPALAGWRKVSKATADIGSW